MSRIRVLLQRRPARVIWGSLWSFPEHGDADAARAWFDAHIIGYFEIAERLSPLAHGFTHYRLQIHPLRWRGPHAPRATGDNGDLRWIARDALPSLGIPAPVRKLLEA